MTAAAAAEPLAIVVRDLSIRFDALLAVSEATLPVRRGEFVSIVGPSGCGKTTILNLVAGLLPTSMATGTCLVNGKPPTSGNRDIAYMLARDALCPWRTALENAELGCEIRGVPAPTRRQRARELLRQVGLSDFEHAYPKALSQGMRQRTALARTFAMESPILLMDEPFGALDAQTKLVLEDVLLSLWQHSDSTVLFITHDLSEAVSMSDRVVVMSARPGRIVADIAIPLGRPRFVRALQKEPAYHELYADIWARLEAGLPGVKVRTGGNWPLLFAARVALCVVVLGLWQWAADSGAIEAVLIGRPTEMAAYLWNELFVTGSLLVDLKWTLIGVAASFFIGSVTGMSVGLLFATQPFVERLLDPFVTALNAMPRIALAPLFIIWFGLGVGSKIALGVSLTFFVVLSATTAGVRSVNADHLTLARTLGASGAQVFRSFVLPNAVPVVFAGLRLGLLVSLLGVVGGEVIAAEHGLGQTISVLAATFRTSGVFALMLLLALIGVAVTKLMDTIEAHLLRWQ